MCHGGRQRRSGAANSCEAAAQLDQSWEAAGIQDWPMSATLVTMKDHTVLSDGGKVFLLEDQCTMVGLLEETTVQWRIIMLWVQVRSKSVQWCSVKLLSARISRDARCNVCSGAQWSCSVQGSAKMPGSAEMPNAQRCPVELHSARISRDARCNVCSGAQWSCSVQGSAKMPGAVCAVAAVQGRRYGRHGPAIHEI